MTVVAATKRELAALGKRSSRAAESALAATALALAAEMDDPENSATSKAACARALSEVLAQIRGDVPDEKKKDGLDELKAKREKRRSGDPAA